MPNSLFKCYLDKFGIDKAPKEYLKDVEEILKTANQKGEEK